VVSKEELLTQLWPGQYVGDAVLHTCILAVRKALHDAGRLPALLHTIRCRGYRFVAPVTVRDSAAPVEEQPPLLATVPEPVDMPGPPTISPNADSTPSRGVTLAADGEYKPTTVLRCILADAPALAARFGSEALYHVMQAFLALAHEVMQHYDGTLTHVTGEGFTALFGAPVAQEDHAQRAVLAALLLYQRLDELPTPNALDRGSGLALRTGMHTGQVVVGPLPQLPHSCYIAEGPTVHLATLLQQRAAPGTILISAATRQRLLENVQAATAGTITVPGISIPIPVYAVQGLVPQRAGVAGRGTQHQSPFVGRERELALLHARLAQVVQGQGQVVGILGEAGIGKSRLLEEFRRGLTGQSVTYAIGHCLPYSQTTPYQPVRDLLRQCCGLTEADSSAAITSKVHQCLRATGLMPEDEAPWLLQLLDVPGTATHLAQCDPYTRKMRTFALLHHVILHACRHQPLILAVENLQWIDATSEAWFAALVERLAGVSLLLLASYRPGYRPPWLSQSLVTQVALPGLLPQESLTVVHAVPGPAPLPRHLAQEIVTRAAGNPFFMEELAWSVATHDHRHTAPTLPDTVQAVLTARIDRLPPAAKQLLQLAAVIGTTVPVSLLRAGAEVPEAALHGGLAHLQGAEFLYETRFLPDGEYTFKHVLTHEVAYGSLLQERRQALHARIFEAIEQLATGRLTEQVDRLAHHALRGEVWDKALTYCRQAGARAAARSAYYEAAASFEQALTALAQLPECRDTLEQATDLRLDLHRALMPLDACARTFEHLRAAQALAERLVDARRLERIAGYLCSYCSNVGEHDRAITAGQRAFARATTSGVFDVQVWVQTPLGQAYYYGGDWRQALDYARRTMALLTGELRSASFGYLVGPAVASRRIVAWSLAELGALPRDATWQKTRCGLPRRSHRPTRWPLRFWRRGWSPAARGTSAPRSPCWNGASHFPRVPTSRVSSPCPPRPWGRRTPWLDGLRRPARSWTRRWSVWLPGAAQSAKRLCSLS
jgi:class 3 adenylate cyclase/tetratricopeptide (TPR) repeat protein